MPARWCGLVFYGLGRNCSPDAVEPLIAQLNRDWNGYVRKGVVCRKLLPPHFSNTASRSAKTDISAVPARAASALGSNGRCRL